MVHVISSSHFAMKTKATGVDATITEGFEAGGHDGCEGAITLRLIPLVRVIITLPLAMAGGTTSGEMILVMYVLGAEGVWLGTRFALTEESSTSRAFKEYYLHLKEGDIHLLLKKLSLVRLACGNPQRAVEAAGAVGATEEELCIFLSRERVKRGVFEGDLEEGELRIGQAVALLHGKGMQTAGEVTYELIMDYQHVYETLAVNIYEHLEI